MAAAVTIPIRAFSRSEILQLYKQCLTLIRTFPSIKRDELYEDIRAEFRERKTLTDEVEITHAVEVAMRGITTMSKYTGNDAKQTKWQLDLEQDPLGQAFFEKRREENDAERDRKLESGELQPEDLIEPEIELDEVHRRIAEWEAKELASQEREGDVLRIRRD